MVSILSNFTYLSPVNKMTEKPTLEHEEKITSDIINKGDNHLQGSATLEDVLTHNKPKLFGKGMLQLYGICFLIYFCSTMNGFDGSLMSSINTLPVYLDYFNQEKASAGTGLVFSIFNIGSIGGTLFSAVLTDLLGRRAAIFIGCVGVVIGTCVTATCSDINVLIGGRFLLSFFSAISSMAAPMYCVEISPPHIRGAVSGCYNCLYYLGSMLAAFSIYGCMVHFPDSPKAFQIPLWLQMLCPGIVCIVCFFLPESPRYLVGTDRQDKARELIIKYHCNGDEDHPLVDLEMSEMILSLHDVALADPKTFFDIRELFMTHGQRYRTALVIAFSWFSQCKFYIPPPAKRLSRAAS